MFKPADLFDLAQTKCLVNPEHASGHDRPGDTMLAACGGDECRLDAHVGYAIHRHACGVVVKVDGRVGRLHDGERYRLVTRHCGWALHNATLRIA